MRRLRHPSPPVGGEGKGASLTGLSFQPLFYLLVLSALRGALYLAAVPPWQNPDEPTHFEYAALAAAGRPAADPRPDLVLQKKIILSLDQHRFWEYEGLQRPDPLPATFAETPLLKEVPTQIGRKPFLYYLLASFPLRLVPERPLAFQLYLLRSLSLLFTLGTIVAIWSTARLVLPADPVFPFAAAAAAAFVPQFILAGTSAGPDALSNLLCAWIIFLAIAVAVRGISLPRLLSAVAVTLLAVLTTYKSLEIVPVLFAGIALSVFRPGTKKRRTAAGAVSLLVLIALYSALVWTTPGTVRVVMARLADLGENLSGWLRGEARVAARSYPGFHRELFRSFWVKFGWARFSLPAWYYAITASASLAAAGGLVFSLLSVVAAAFRPRAISQAEARGCPITAQCRGDDRARWRPVCLLLLACLCALAGYYGYWGLQPRISTVQGRHLFPAISAWAILFVLGGREIVAPRWRNAVSGAILGLLAVLDAIAIFLFIFPTFR